MHSAKPQQSALHQFKKKIEHIPKEARFKKNNRETVEAMTFMANGVSSKILPER